MSLEKGDQDGAEDGCDEGCLDGIELAWVDGWTVMKIAFVWEVAPPWRG